MKAEQISFAAGEISPILHARTDLTRYKIGLAELVNMIVLPQGGVTRRAGMTKLSAASSETVKLIPFEYNTTDSVMLEFGNKDLRVWRKYTTAYSAIARISTPYTASEVKDLRYIQSGNVMFLTHKDHKPMMLRRKSLILWTLEELPYRGGPWINGEEWASGVKLRFGKMAASKTINSIGGNVFTSNVAGSLLKVEYAVAAKTIELISSAGTTDKTGEIISDGAESEPFVVKGTLNITTAGDWTGLIKVYRSADGGNTWVTIRQYRRTNIETQGQWDFTISETEENILYKVTARHDTEASEDSGSSGGGGSSGEDSSTYYFHAAEEGGHPDVEGGENYVYFMAWIRTDPLETVLKQGTAANGLTFYYNSYLKQTFYVIGVDSQSGYYDKTYGYYEDGFPVGYDENGNWIGE